MFGEITAHMVGYKKLGLTAELEQPAVKCRTYLHRGGNCDTVSIWADMRISAEAVHDYIDEGPVKRSCTVSVRPLYISKIVLTYLPRSNCSGSGSRGVSVTVRDSIRSTR